MNRQAVDLTFGIAAVSHFIDPASLAVRTGQDPSAVAELLLPEVETELDDSGKRRWMLKAATRRRVLASANQTSALAWLGLTNPETEVDDALQGWLRGTLDVEVAARASRDTVQRVASWLSDCRWLQPPAKEAMRTIELASLRKHLEDAAGGAFFGRGDDRQWLSKTFAAGPIAVVEADGGMGKSALLARWLLDEHGFAPAQAVISIDFDDPALNIASPDYLFLEVARQAALQVPTVQWAHQALREQSHAAKQRHGVGIQAQERQRDDSRLGSLLVSLFSTLADSTRSSIVVLDTMERALRGPKLLVEGFVRLLQQAIQGLPTVKMLVAGRGPIDIDALSAAPRRRLEPLARKDAQRLLLQRGAPADVVERILARVPASPLTLRLAARAVSRLGSKVLDDEELDFAIESAQINGYLHARVLSHLPSRRLSDVARRALLIRTLTPALLLEVIGPLTEPPIEDPGAAERLFAELASVSDLATMTVGQRLTLRPEIFEEVTRLLHAEDPTRSARVHERAQRIFGRSRDSADLEASEYHAQALASLSEAKWNAGVGGKAPGRQLLAEVPHLLRSGRNKEALEVVVSEPSAQRDPGLLLLGARAASRLADHEQLERLAKRASLCAERPLHRAQAAMFLAIAADAGGDAAAAHGERAVVRSLASEVAGSDVTVLERAELIASLDGEDREAVVRELRQLFVTEPARDTLVAADLDLTRKISSLVRTPEIMMAAANAKAFEHPAPLDFSGLMDRLMSYPSVLASLDLPPEVEGGCAKLEVLRRSRSLSTTVEFLLPRTRDDDGVRDALADLLDQMRTPTGSVLIDTSERAAEIAELVNQLYSSGVELASLFANMKGHPFKVDRPLKRSSLHSLILQIDRMRLGFELVEQLVRYGLGEPARLAAELFTRDQPTSSSVTPASSGKVG